MQKIMIVEDDPKIAEHLKTHIEKYGYHVTCVTDFDNIMEEFNKINPDLVLLDINLPSFDGYYWFRQIRRVSVCPVIFISARIGEMDQVMALENGGDDYITKLFSAKLSWPKFVANSGEPMVNMRQEQKNVYWISLDLSYIQREWR
jgi:two-component system, OmpR family, response regulator YxdJ